MIKHQDFDTFFIMMNLKRFCLKNTIEKIYKDFYNVE